MTSDGLSLGKQARDYLVKFSSERSQGRSGKLHWDSFLIHAHKENIKPPAVDLYTWLQEHLTHPADADIEALIQDYQRIGTLLSSWEQTVVGQRFVSKDFEHQQQKLLQDVSSETSIGALPLGNYVPLEPSLENGSIFCSLPADMRLRNPHILLVGRRHTGKTDLMSRMVIQDIISNDRAIVAIDADGRLVDLVQRWSAEQPNSNELSKRILVVDPAAGKNTFSYNPLKLPANGDLKETAAAVTLGFKALYEEPPGAQSQWNAQTANILRNSTMLLIANGKSLADLSTLLTDKDYRDTLLEKLESIEGERPEYKFLLGTWSQYKKLSRTDQWIGWVEPILNRVVPTLGDPRMRTMITSSADNLNLNECIVDKKAVLLRIPQKDFNQSATLLGSLLVTGLMQASTSLWATTSAQVSPVALYIDRMSNLLDEETISSITDDTSKHNIGLIASTRHLATLERRQIAFRNIETCFNSIAAFSVDREDALLLAPKLFPFDSNAIKPSHIGARDQESLNVQMLMLQEPGNYLWWFVAKAGAILPLCLTQQKAMIARE